MAGGAYVGILFDMEGNPNEHDLHSDFTILYKLELDGVVMTIPRIGINVEVFEYKRVILYQLELGEEIRSQQ